MNKEFVVIPFKCPHRLQTFLVLLASEAIKMNVKTVLEAAILLYKWITVFPLRTFSCHIMEVHVLGGDFPYNIPVYRT